MSSSMEPTGYIHLLCGTYIASAGFAEADLGALQARDARAQVRCPGCEVATESRSYLPTYKTEPIAAVPGTPPEIRRAGRSVQ